jgi:hypothetical protein
MTDQTDLPKLVRDRIENQAHSHWHEFSVIVASANVLLALVLYGQILSTAHTDRLTLFAGAIALCSTLAAMFAYYAIQIGILFVFGPLRLIDVLVSFLIAATQLALFLWPAHVLSTTSVDREDRARTTATMVNLLRTFRLRWPASQLACGKNAHAHTSEPCGGRIRVASADG